MTTATKSKPRKGSKQAKRAAKAKAGANKSKKAPVKRTGPNNRVKFFQTLARNPKGLTGAQITEKLGMKPGHGQIGIFLRGELTAKRIKSLKETETGPLVYSLTALGKKHLEEGKVDSFGREKHLVQLGRAWEN